MKRIILGSSSPRRKELMQQIGIPFDVMVSKKEEVYTSEIPSEIVKELALLKANDIAGQVAKGVVIGADTVVVNDGRILGKPKDEEDAVKMIRSLQGKPHEVYTGVAIVEADEAGVRLLDSHAVCTKVYVNPMSEEEIRAYVATKEPMDKAGGYGIQGKFSAYIEGIQGDYFNVVGLPVSYIYRRLKELSLFVDKTPEKE